LAVLNLSSLVILGLSAVWISIGCFAAQGPGTDSVGSATHAPTLPGDLSGTNQPRTRVPAPPGTQSPAAHFAELLAMSPAERERSLSDRTEKQRATIEKGLREYELLPAAERDARLHEMDLAWHVESLMKLPPAKRALRLANVPAALRPMVEERLRIFDLLPPDKQKESLAYPTTANFLLAAKPPGPPLPGASTSPPPLPGEPSRLSANLREFLALSPREQQKALESLPPPERVSMARTLKTFADMQLEQRRICLDSLERFCRLNKEQRDEFFKNAARWKAMSPRERDTWRELIEIVPPAGPSPLRTPAPPGGETAGPATASNSPAPPSAPGAQERGH
jgi:hypothetical protein